MIKNSITFFLEYYIYFGVLLFLIFIIPIKKTKIILIAINQDFFFNRILKKCSTEKIDDFLKILKKNVKKINN